MNITLRVLALVLILATICSAQAGRNEVRGDVGLMGFLDDGNENHFLAGGSVRAYLTPRFSFQPEFQYLRRTAGGNHYDVVALAGFAFDFRRPGAKVVPYLTIGPGIMYTNEGRFSNTQLMVSGGGGVKIFLNDRWYVAPDVRIGWEPHARFSVGIGYVVRR